MASNGRRALLMATGRTDECEFCIDPTSGDRHEFKTLAPSATLVAAAAASTLLTSTARFAQAKEQFFPVLVYRTGAYAPNGVPFANGYVDYLKLSMPRAASTA
jgi:hypothetical protein